MGTINPRAAYRTATSRRWLALVVGVVIGSGVTAVGTDYARENIIDFDIPFGDSVYSTAIGMGLLAVAEAQSGSTTVKNALRGMAIGSFATSATISGEEIANRVGGN